MHIYTHKDNYQQIQILKKIHFEMGVEIQSLCTISVVIHEYKLTYHAQIETRLDVLTLDLRL